MLPKILHDLDEVLRPQLATNQIHDQGPGQAQLRDSAAVRQYAVEHPSAGEDPEVGSLSAKQAADDVDRALAEGRAVVSERRLTIAEERMADDCPWSLGACVIVDSGR